MIEDSEGKNPRGNRTLVENDTFFAVVAVLWATHSVLSLLFDLSALAHRAARADQGGPEDLLDFAVVLVYGVAPIWGLYWLRKKRGALYPEPGLGHRELLTKMFYGRVLTWKQTWVKMPKSLLPTLAFAFAVVCLMSPCFLIMTAGALTVPPASVAKAALFEIVGPVLIAANAVGAAVLLYWMLWRDYAGDTESQEPEALLQEAHTASG